MLASRPGALFLILASVYVGSVAGLFIRGTAIVAAYLTMPAWSVVSTIAFGVALVAPDTVSDSMLYSWGGNLAALLVSALLNVAGVHFVVRRLSRP